jgi:hypothetical protein
LHVGVLEGVELSTSQTGTAQGSVLSPLLGNVYLHYALDRWFERRVKPRLRGQATLVRYADDFVIGFEYQDDAQRVMDALGPRLGHFGLTLHPDKTRLFSFRRPPKESRSGKGRATFDFLGFTFYWARTRKGGWGMFCKTRSASLRRTIQSVYDWCRRHRHLPAHFAQSEQPFRFIVNTRFAHCERGRAPLARSSLLLGFLLPSGRSL